MGPRSALLRRWPEALMAPVDAASLAVFRILFGELMVWQAVRYAESGRIASHYIQPLFHFPYPFFEFVRPWPGQGMYWHFAVMGVAALGLALGWCYRVCAWTFFLSDSYVFLLDKSYYNNHSYLIILLAFLLAVVGADRWAALDRWRRPTVGTGCVPRWHLMLLQAQLVIVYVYAGLAKLNPDWLRGEPVRHWLAERVGIAQWLGGPALEGLLTQEWVVYGLSYGGLLFDLSVGWLLLWRRTRLLGVGLAVAFHGMNSWLFSVGIFPQVMIATLLVFGEPDWPRRVWQRLRGHRGSPAGFQPGPAATIRALGGSGQRRWAVAFVGLYLALQLLVTLRSWLYPGDVAWTEEGHRFSWRMKLRDKAGEVRFLVTDPATGRGWTMDPAEHLTEEQVEEMGGRPDMILQYAHFLARRLQTEGVPHPVIRADAWVSLNFRPPQRLIDPGVNLTEVRQVPWERSDWILPPSGE